MDLLVIDNYDSFTYNLVQYIGEVASVPRVVRNDKITVEEIKKDPPEAIVISPGPGRPSDAGISLAVIEKLGPDLPILGVCLGQQCIASVFGGEIVQSKEIYHGKTSPIYHAETPLYKGVENPFEATRYHSLEVDPATLPDELAVDALTEDNEIMGLHHVEFPLIGVQYHPESILTQAGKKIIKNFLDYARNPRPLGDSELVKKT